MLLIIQHDWNVPFPTGNHISDGTVICQAVEIEIMLENDLF